MTVFFLRCFDMLFYFIILWCSFSPTFKNSEIAGGETRGGRCRHSPSGYMEISDERGLWNTVWSLILRQNAKSVPVPTTGALLAFCRETVCRPRALFRRTVPFRSSGIRQKRMKQAGDHSSGVMQNRNFNHQMLNFALTSIQVPSWSVAGHGRNPSLKVGLSWDNS